LTALTWLYLTHNDFCVSPNTRNFLGSIRYSNTAYSNYGTCTPTASPTTSEPTTGVPTTTAPTTTQPTEGPTTSPTPLPTPPPSAFPTGSPITVTFTEIGVGNCYQRIKKIGKPETFKEAQKMFLSEPACEIEGATLQYSRYSKSWGAYCCKPGSPRTSNTNWEQYSISGLTGEESALVDVLNELLNRLDF